MKTASSIRFKGALSLAFGAMSLGAVAAIAAYPSHGDVSVAIFASAALAMGAVSDYGPSRARALPRFNPSLDHATRGYLQKKPAVAPTLVPALTEQR